MKKYSTEWKENENSKRGGWPQKHGDAWKWHYIENETEYSTGEYLTKKDCESENKKSPMKYTVTNIYGIAGESTHYKVERALAAAKKREGEGWIVEDDNGNRWTNLGDRPMCLGNK